MIHFRSTLKFPHQTVMVANVHGLIEFEHRVHELIEVLAAKK
jgi:hypothetical protein